MWTANFRQKDLQTVTMYGGLHPHSDIDHVYVGLSMGDWGLLGGGDTACLERVDLFNYLKSHKGSWYYLEKFQVICRSH